MGEAAGRVFVVGSLNADYVVEVTRRPDPGETVLGRELQIFPGGKGANQAVAAARLGGRVSLLGRVGDDTDGELLRTVLHAAGVDTACVRVTPGVRTGVALITLTPDGENAIIVAPGANAALAPADVAAVTPALARHDVLVAQLEVSMATVAAAVAAACEHGVRVVLNLAPPARLDPAVLAACDPLVVNEHEAGWLLGERVDGVVAAGAAGRRLRDLGARSAVVTLGAAGAVAVDPAGEIAHLPARRVQPVDTTGAGDAFVGALAVRLARGDDLVAAARYAVEIGTRATLSPGAQLTPEAVVGVP